MEEFKNKEERSKAEGEGIREEKHDPSAAKHELMPEVSSDSTPSILNPVRTAVQPGGLKPSTDMEVHHHGHVHDKKKWKEYVFQFFMLFLAVFCGFLAEYQLEHTIEHKREKQFMRSMVEDLEKDVTAIEIETRRILQQQAGLDSLVLIIHGGNMEQPQVSKMYELQRKYIGPLKLTLVNRTELQLKNAAGMRLILSKQAADSIIHYWSMTDLLYGSKESINEHRKKAKDISFTIFNSKYYEDTEFFTFDKFTAEPELISKSSAALPEFVNRVSHVKDLLKYEYKLRLDMQADYAKKLIRLIKKEYHLQ